jgi:PP-loop superfamily ATP-utilizing enzyme
MDVLGKMADEAKSFIRRVTEKYEQNEVPVAYSGGADLTALLSLAVEALGRESHRRVHRYGHGVPGDNCLR